MSIENILTVSLTLFAVIDMLGNIPLVIKLRKDYGEINSVESSIISAIVMIVGLFAGNYIFKLLGIEVSHFAIAGSLLLMYFGTKMVIGIEDSKPTNTNSQKIKKSATVFPLAFPLIAGPGTLSTIMSFKSDFSNIEIVIGILINSIVIFAVLKLADVIKRVMGENGINLLERFFGIILISIAIKMFLTNLIISINML